MTAVYTNRFSTDDQLNIKLRIIEKAGGKVEEIKVINYNNYFAYFANGKRYTDGTYSAMIVYSFKDDSTGDKINRLLLTTGIRK